MRHWYCLYSVLRLFYDIIFYYNFLVNHCYDLWVMIYIFWKKKVIYVGTQNKIEVHTIYTNKWIGTYMERNIVHTIKVGKANVSLSNVLSTQC